MENAGYADSEKHGPPGDSPPGDDHRYFPHPVYGSPPAPVPAPLPAPAAGHNVTVVVARRPAGKQLCDAYLLWFPLGILGLHHFYLRRYGFGCLYLFTLGLGGVGWLVDGFRMKCLVSDANRRIEEGPGHVERKSIVDAYILWFPFGILGFHHYYLGRVAWGVAYTLTAGLFGIGWLLDACLIPTLVKNANKRLESSHGQTQQTKKLSDAYLLGATPAGLFGAHHFYLNSPGFGVLYLFTLGNCGIGWIVDWFRMPVLVKRANNIHQYQLGRRHKFVDEAYIMAFPLGFLGLHHFYLERPVWGVLYLFTLGLGGFGWLVDLCRMPCLVATTNEKLAAEATVVQQVTGHLCVNNNGFIVTRPVTVTVYPAQQTQYQQGVPVSVVNGAVMTSGASHVMLPGETPILQHPQLPPPYTEAPAMYTAQQHYSYDQQTTVSTATEQQHQPPNYGSIDNKQST